MDTRIHTHIDIDARDSVDLNIYQCGQEECSSGHAFGPAVRDVYLIHYIITGSGTFTMNNKVYPLKEGQGFLIPPDVITYYEADTKNPWNYVWVGFNGLKAEAYLKRANLTEDNPIFTSQGTHFEDFILKMIEVNTFSPYRDLELQGYLFLFISELVKNSPIIPASKSNTQDIYIKEAIHFIQTNYSRPIKIADIADNLSIDRSYFSTIFKQSLQKSPQNFLLEYRMNKACELMSNPDLTIRNIAYSVGYMDVFNFSKMFKRVKGRSPAHYRAENYT